MAYPDFRFKPNDIYTDKLDGNISGATDPIVTLDNTNAKAGPGLIKLENEIVKYTTKGANEFSGLTRGYNSTTATSHPSGVDITHPISADIFVKIWEGVEYLKTQTDIAVLVSGAQTIAGAKTFDEGAIIGAPKIYTPDAAGTATLNLALGNEHRITMPAGNITIAISNEADGQKFIISILQDATGSRTVTWFSTIKWAEGSAPTLTTTANKRDCFGFIVTGTDTYDGFIVGVNI